MYKLCITYSVSQAEHILTVKNFGFVPGFMYYQGLDNKVHYINSKWVSSVDVEAINEDSSTE